MTKSFHKILLSSIALATLVLSACEKTVEIDPPLNEITTSVVFSSDKLATNAMAGLYTGLASTVTQSTYVPVYSSLQADDLLYIGVNPTFKEVFDNAYSTLSSVQSSVFSDWYAMIYRANSIIEGLQKYSGTSDQVKKQLTAEAKVIRAYCYFNLVNTFGGVPLVLTTDVSVSAMLPKETVANVYAQITTDLTEGKANLLADYSASGNTRLGVNKFVAAALLARVSLFTADYPAAESNASEVIASNLYSMISSANIATGVWVKNNTESIWQMSSPLNPTQQYTVEAGTFLPFTGSNPQFEIRPAFLSLFSATDLRRQRWMTNYTVAGVIKVVPFKYKYITNAAAVAANVIEAPTTMRLAEQYLIRAEARARIGTNLGGALSDLNVIRTRAQADVSTSTTQAALISEIALENRKEFFCEQAYRWYNLKRTGEADAVIGALKPSYRPAAKLLPFPNNAVDANPNLIQNPGY
ncbi:RagB/SusD family nutrient uptake outer membrane protein [Pedobacter sp.]|uniref:RagB/SusD family nutrient uptake outer membrane protein n=1 Tax=Pedobacter sp. TaxID=1411316 RepID=UPI003BAD0FB1